MIRNNPRAIKAIEDEYSFCIETILGKWQSLREIDDLLTAKIFGFDNVDHYYNHANGRNLMSRIKTQTLFISARDDPITGDECIPYAEFDTNENIYLMVTNAGGHVAHFTSVFSSKQWFNEPAFKFFGCVDKSD